jgi:hypothetical protein
MLKQIFIPSKSNHYRPRVVEPLALGVLVFILMALPFTYNLTSAHKFQVLGYATDISVDNLASLTNQQRAAAGLPGLSLNSKLMQAAQAKAADMFAKNYWAHVSPDGLQPWTFITNAGYAYSYAGENLAKDFLTSSGVMAGWMGSAGHRANILNVNYTDVGFAVMNGNLLGSDTTLVVAEYARPATVAAAPAPAPKPTPKAVATPAPAPVAASTTTEQASPTPVASTAPVTTTTTSAKPTAEANKPTPKPTTTNLPASRKVVNYQELNWGQRISVFLLSGLFLLNVLRHTLVWRRQKRGWRHIWLRAHPAAQMGILALALLATGFSASGVIQ